MGIFEVMTIILVVLKLLGVIEWSWLAVLAPELIAIVLYAWLFISGYRSALRIGTRIRKDFDTYDDFY